MKLKLFLMTAATMALVSSCSSDDVIKDNAEANAITFSVTANNASRSSSMYCNNNMPNDFKVWAEVDGKSYFAGEQYDRDGSTSKYLPNGGEYRYWPSTAVRFYALKDYDQGNFNWDGNMTQPTLTGFTPATTADAQKDFIYAYNSGVRGDGDKNGAKTQELNFRHALSQIVFKAEKKNSKIYVEIEGVTIKNVASQGTFTFPKGTDYTTDNFVNHNNANTAPTTGAEGQQTNQRSGLGTWTFTDDNKLAGNYTVSVLNAENKPVVLLEDTPTNLTNNEGVDLDKAESYKKSFMLMPQKNDVDYTPATPIGDPATTGQKCTYFLLNCRIWNLTSDENSFVAANEVNLWGTNNGDGTYGYKQLLVPVKINWEQGKKYIYTFIFNDKGNGGYDPETGKDVLIPIELNVTVDDFALGTEETENL